MIDKILQWWRKLTHKNTDRMLNFILFGPPGSGKGTQAKKLEEKFNLIHISTGDLFRYEIGNGTPLGLKAKKYMDDGHLVPDEVTIEMLKNKVEKHPEAAGFIFDGFPRTVPQAEALDAFLAEKDTTIAGLLMLNVDDDEIVARILNRGKTSGRSDDNDESIIRNRIKVFNDQTAPIFEHYKMFGKSQHIEGVGSIDDIFERLSDAIDATMA